MADTCRQRWTVRALRCSGLVGDVRPRGDAGWVELNDDLALATVALALLLGVPVAHVPATGGLGDAIHLYRVGDECCGGVDPDVPVWAFLEINSQARSRVPSQRF